MSEQTEVGLFGELLVVEAILATGAAPACSWRGGVAEEHDFGCVDADIEVKTSSGERRRHWVHGLTQMVPTGDTALWLLSLQVTRAGAGRARTLPELVDSVLDTAVPRDREQIERNLAAAGWHEAQRDLFGERWRLRTPPLALRVDAGFPRLTPQLLARAEIDLAALRQVYYEIDVTDRAPSAIPPSTMRAIVDQMSGAADA